jgi:hypothetical protein
MRFAGLIAMAWLMVAGVVAPAAAELLPRPLAAEPDDAAWRVLRDTGTADQLRRYIAQAPDGPHRREAEERLKILEPDDAAWRILRDTGTADQLRRYIAQAPDGPHRREVEERLKILEGKIAELPTPPVTAPADPVQETTPAGKPAGARHGFRPALAPQKVVLYEEDPANSTGVQFPGAVLWRTVRAKAAQEAGIAIRGDIEIPARNLSVRVFIRRNDDPALPASHTVEIVFNVPPGFLHQGIGNVPGIMVKPSEQSRGIVLNGVAVKVTGNYFLVGLSEQKNDMERNVALLKERTWFDIPVVFSDGKRAIIAIEKGAPGARAFTAAFAAWERDASERAARAP